MRAMMRVTLVTSSTESDADAPTLEEWGRWIVDNAAAGAARADVERVLLHEGGRAAKHHHQALLDVAFTDVMQPHLERLVRRAEQMSAVLDLVDELADGPIERRSGVDADDFERSHVRACRPVVLTDVCDAWPARSRWGIADLRERFADVRVHVAQGEDRRDGDFKSANCQMTIAAFCDLLDARADHPANDVYMVSRNQAIREGGLQPLLDDVVVDERYLDAQRIQQHTALWVGPAGTYTPLHHDQTSVLFCQVVGQKRFRLLSPTAQDVLPHVDGFYADGIPESVWQQAQEVVVNAGEALFIPVGWWHEVCAESFSMSLTFMNLRGRANTFPWLRL